ncbi:MAG: flagellar biosynthetic protein FliO [Pseudomonadales bacterium]|nr:flagellar biosynthetic protein FliO [Pseudomonadales bacterium]
MRIQALTGKALSLAVLALGALLPLASWADDASAPLNVAKEGIFTPAYLLQSFGGLVIVIALILVLAMLFRRFGDAGLGTPGNMKVLGGISVGQRERLVLVQIGSKQLLVGVAPGNVSQVMVFDEPLDNTLNQPMTMNPLLKRFLKDEKPEAQS